MLVTDLNGKKSSWKIRGEEVLLQDSRPRSSLHVRARELLKKRYPTQQILEEVGFNPIPKKTLYFDYFFPLLKMAVEVQGEQHFSFNSMFHATKFDFLEQKKKDNMKREWCELNGIKLIELPYNTIDDWDKLI